MAATVPARLTREEGRKFGLVLGFAFLALAAVLLWRGLAYAALVAAVLSTALLLAALLVPGRLGPVQRAWMGFALAISRVTTPVFMSVVFYAVLTPIGLLKRLFTGNPVLRTRGAPTYWLDRAPEDGRRSNLERQF